MLLFAFANALAQARLFYGVCVEKSMELLSLGLASCCEDYFQEGWPGD